MLIFGKDVPLDRPSPNGRAAVFVPHHTADKAVMEVLKNGSGMVGFGNAEGTITVYFENNKFNEGALSRWSDKCFKAYDRMTKAAPTVNKMTADAGNFYQVGLIEGHEIMVTDMAALKRWLEQSGAPDSAPESAQIFAGPPEKKRPPIGGIA